MDELAARFDHALATVLRALPGDHGADPVPDAGSDPAPDEFSDPAPEAELSRPSVTSWLGALLVAMAVTLVLGRLDSWPASVVSSLLLMVPVTMIALRAVIDEVRGSYTRGGPVVLVILTISFLAALLATQPI